MPKIFYGFEQIHYLFCSANILDNKRYYRCLFDFCFYLLWKQIGNQFYFRKHEAENYIRAYKSFHTLLK